MNPQWPIYIVSKGRAQSRLTVKALDAIKLPYSIVVEAQEYEDYVRVIDRTRVLVLDPWYQRKYETCDTLGDRKSKGPGPARNFVWDHAEMNEADWHWVLDDNIRQFYRVNNNLKIPIADGTIFRCMEDFAARYKNVGMVGPTYFQFVKRKFRVPPYILNTRIYSCNLIKHETAFRWRGRYNEDTDLSIRMLKAGWCTVLFNAFLQYKMTTQSMRGGNTDAFYIKEGTTAKSRMLAAMHPEICRLTKRFRRVHHYADYAKFKHLKLIRKAGVAVPEGVDDYGMVLEKVH